MEENLQFTFYIQYFEHKLLCHSKIVKTDIENCIIFILNGIRKQYAEGKLKLLSENNESLSVDDIVKNRIPYVFIELPGRIDIETQKKIGERKTRTFYTLNENNECTIEKIKQTQDDEKEICFKTLAKTKILNNINFATEFDKLKNKNQFISLYSVQPQNISSKKDKKGFTFAEVAKHNSPDDAWMIINGEIYDITEYSKIHPGGKQILIKNAGLDGTELIIIQLVKFHPYINAQRMLEKYYQGYVKQ